MIDFLTTSDVVILSIATLILGMYVLIKGGDWTIDAAVDIARHYGISPLLIGFTIVAFGTSLPELIASVNANLKGTPGLAVGNVIGSNIANLLLIGGASALVVPIVANIKALRNDLIAMAAATLGWFGVLIYLSVDLWVGMTAIGLLIAYVVYQYKLAKHGELPKKPIIEMEKEAEKKTFHDYKKSFFMLLGGLVALAIGAELLIRGSVTTARIIGVSDGVIGLTIVALGTSLPELTTCISAALKRQSDMIIGNLVGSNVFNLMMILGSMGIIKTYGLDAGGDSLLTQDFPIMIAVTALFTIWLLAFKKINRPIGVIFVLAYIAYMGMLAIQTI